MRMIELRGLRYDERMISRVTMATNSTELLVNAIGEMLGCFQSAIRSHSRVERRLEMWIQRLR